MTYIILAENDNRLKRHESKDEAMLEAERLCRRENKRIAVYNCIGEMRMKEFPIEFIAPTKTISEGEEI